MKIKLQREKLIEILGNLINICSDKTGQEITACVKMVVKKDEIKVIATDLQIEMVVKAPLDSNEVIEVGEVCISAKKLLEIIKALPAESIISLDAKAHSCAVTNNKSKFKLSTQATKNYPSIRTEHKDTKVILVNSSELNRLFNKTAFSMAVNDVRYVLNGMLIEVGNGLLKTVTTDGHRLSICSTEIADMEYESKAILPKKSVREISKYSTGNEDIALKFNRDSLELTFGHEKSKFNCELNLYICLVDGKFPDYQKIIPHGNDIIATLNRQDFLSAINRVSILSNERLRAVYTSFSEGEISLRSSNPEQDEAIEFVSAEYESTPMEMNFNSQYLIEALNVIDFDSVVLEIADPIKPMLIKNPNDPSQQYIVMPMRM